MLDDLTRKSLYIECNINACSGLLYELCLYFEEFFGILNRSESISRSLWKFETR